MFREVSELGYFAMKRITAMSGMVLSTWNLLFPYQLRPDCILFLVLFLFLANRPNNTDGGLLAIQIINIAYCVHSLESSNYNKFL